MTAFQKQSQGQRKQQEDAVHIIYQNEDDPKSDVLLLLADGMGGHVGGEVASNLALKAFANAFIGATEIKMPSARIDVGIDEANRALASRISQHPELNGMGCTFLGALKIGDDLHWGSVGDSILFLYRSGTLHRMNADHSVYGALKEQVAAGNISQTEADNNPKRNALRSAMTGKAIKLKDIGHRALLPDDVVILASDGLETLDDDEITYCIDGNANNYLEDLASDLLEAVRSKNLENQDNTSLVIYRHDTAGPSIITKRSLWGTMGEDLKTLSRFLPLAAGIALFVSVAAVGGFVLSSFLTAADTTDPMEEVVVPDKRTLNGNGFSNSNGSATNAPSSTQGTQQEDRRPLSTGQNTEEAEPNSATSRTGDPIESKPLSPATPRNRAETTDDPDVQEEAVPKREEISDGDGAGSSSTSVD